MHYGLLQNLNRALLSITSADDMETFSNNSSTKGDVLG
jgi:hypothetical protein